MRIRELKGRDFLSLRDYSAEELMFILRFSRQLREDVRRGITTKLLLGRILAMIFQKPSTRTRISFEVAMEQLGGHAVSLRWDELQLARGETIADTARILSRYVDGIVARVFRHADLEELAEHATVPVINGLSDLLHPCQALSDLFTIWDKKGKLRGLKLAWIGDGNNVCNSLLIGCSIVGMSMSVACPKGYEPNADILRWAEEVSDKSGAEIEVTEEPEEAVKDADIIYTDTFVSMGMEAEREERLKTFLPKYQVTPKLLSLAKKDVAFMHCLPAHRGEEVTDEVIDGPNSIVWDQAENRLHVERGLLFLLIR